MHRGIQLRTADGRAAFVVVIVQFFHSEVVPHLVRMATLQNAAKPPEDNYFFYYTLIDIVKEVSTPNQKAKNGHFTAFRLSDIKLSFMKVCSYS